MTTNFKFIIGQRVVVVSNDRAVNNSEATILSRHSNQWSDYKDNQPVNWYKVKKEGIHAYLSFFEHQLKEAK